MSTPVEETPIPPRNYECQEEGCGNQFDYIVLEAREGESMWLCMPHFLTFAVSMMQAATEAKDA